MVGFVTDRGTYRTVVAFACLYFFWGSTYAAIHVAGEGLAPSLVAGCRTILSAVLLFALGALRGKSLRVTAGEAWRLALIGVLMMSVNSILLTWAETMVSSGLSSLVVATISASRTSFMGGSKLQK